MAWEGSTRKQRLPSDWERRRKRILKRDPICTICHKRPSRQVDHEERGDDHSDTNLRGVCDPCHRIKSSKEGTAARARKYNSKRPAERHPGWGVTPESPFAKERGQ